MKDKKYQHFLNTYKLINTNHKLFKKHAKSKLLTHHEKQILKAVFEYKKENLEDAKEILNAITDGQSAFIQGHKHLVWGMIYNHQGLYNKAAKELVKILYGAIRV